MIYLSIGTFLFLLNLFTVRYSGDWWFMFPMLPLGLILAFHFIFSIGKDYTELAATRWEAREQGRDLDEYIHFLEDEFEDTNTGLELRSYQERKIFSKRHLDEDFV
jgi:hypothetical protein